MHKAHRPATNPAEPAPTQPPTPQPLLKTLRAEDEGGGFRV